MDRNLEKRLRFEAAMANRHGSTADADRHEAQADLLTAQAELERARASAAREHARQAVQRAALRHLDEVWKNRLADIPQDANTVLLLRELRADIRAVLDEAAADTPAGPEDGAWGTVWLEGKWRWLTSKMTTEEREYAADCVARWSARLAADDGDLERGEPDDLRWWREDR